MKQTEIIDYIDHYLESNQGFLSGHELDFALDIRSFVMDIELSERELVEAA